MYLWLADAILVFHASLVFTVITGTGLVVARAWRRVPKFCWWAYGLAMGGMIISQLLIGNCILTVWEKDLRNLNAPGSAYVNSCIGHYLPWLPPFVLRIFGPLLVVAAAVTLLLDWWVLRREKRKAPP